MERVLEQLMDFEVTSGIQAAARAVGSPPDLPEWVSGTTAAHAAGHAGVAQVPKLRQGSYFPSFWNRADSLERALTAVIQEAWIGGMSTRKVDGLVQTLGMTGITKSQSVRLVPGHRRAREVVSERAWRANGSFMAGRHPFESAHKAVRWYRSPR